MPSTYTTSGRLEQQATGENVNTYGVKLDNTIARVDDLVCGYVALSIAASGDYTLQVANDNTTPDEARRAHLKLIGSPANNFNVIIPGVSKSYWIWNATAKVATITTGSGTTVSIDAGDILPVWCDGTNVNSIYFGGFSLKPFIAASVLAATGSLPATTGNDGKALFVRSGSWVPSFVSTTDLSDYQTKVLGVQIALAVAL